MRTRQQRGQAIIELAIATPVILALLLGAFDVTVMVSDKVIAGYAARQGARLGSEIGGKQTNPTLTTQQVDSDIVRNVLAVARAMNYSTLVEVDIYQPSNPNGTYTSGDPINQYDPSGNPIAPTSFTGGEPTQPNAFPISARKQVPPTETSLGVKVSWRYNPPTGFATFTINLSEYAVMKASPVLP